MALAAGAAAENLAQGQYGIASVAPRWNLSGTYQQVLPRYLSVDDQGGGTIFGRGLRGPRRDGRDDLPQGLLVAFDSRKARSAPRASTCWWWPRRLEAARSWISPAPPGT